jgi:transcriptional regulator with XRE-family HTH domain
MIRGRLIKVREKRGITQEQLAEAIGVDDLTIYRWEQGISTPQGRNKYKLIEFFGVSADDLDLGRRRNAEQDNYPILSALSKQGLTVRLIAIVSSSAKATSRDIINLDHKIRQELELVMDNTITRREAILALMGLPGLLYHVSATNSAEDPAEEIIRHIAAGIAACSQLGRGAASDLLLASQTLSSYLPSLKAIVQNSSRHRATAAGLVAQCLIQKAGIAIHVQDSKRAVKYAEQAMIYAQASKNKIMEVAAASRLTWVLFGDHQHTAAMQQALMTVSLLDKAQQSKVVIPTLMRSAVHGDAALYQAVNGRKEDALQSLGLARATFDSTKDDGPNYLAWSEDLFTLFEGRTLYFNGDTKTAYEIMTRVIDPNTFEPKMAWFTRDTKPQALNFLTQASLKLPQKDMQLSIKLWKAGLQSTIETRSKQRYGEVRASLDIMNLWINRDTINQIRANCYHLFCFFHLKNILILRASVKGQPRLVTAQ